ncbi:MAG TPA: hypothetical protein VI731_02670 [Bacteroidia bacterium]|nr:hypothetical protein [Bacteroidia bacterium]
MKTINYFLITTAAWVLLFFACRKDSNVPSPDLNQTPDRGGLAFIVKDISLNRLAGVAVGIAFSQEDLESNNYLLTRVTGSDGRADFGQLLPANYYYEADVTLNGIDHHAEGQVVVEAGENIERELIIQ